MVPGLDRYFVTSHYDDPASVLGIYGPEIVGSVRGLLHGFTTTPGMLGVICSAVGGALAAVVAMLLTHAPITAGLVGAGAFLIVFTLEVASSQRRMSRLWRSLDAIFPRDGTRR
jgi:hypothetical protein